MVRPGWVVPIRLDKLPHYCNQLTGCPDIRVPDVGVRPPACFWVAPPFEGCVAVSEIRIRLAALTRRLWRMGISRREFVKLVTASGIALSLSPLAMAEEHRILRRARHCRDDNAGIRPRPAPAASTASPRSPAPSSTRRIFAPPISRAGRRIRRTPCSSAPRTPRTSTPASTSRA